MRHTTGGKVSAWTPTLLPELLTPLEVAEKLNVTRRTVYRWIETGKIKPQRVGDKLVQIPVTELQRFLAESGKPKETLVAVIPEDDLPDAASVQAELMTRMLVPSPVQTVKNKPVLKGRRR